MNPHHFGNLDPDQDPHQGDKPDPDPDSHQLLIRLRIRIDVMRISNTGMRMHNYRAVGKMRNFLYGCFAFSPYSKYVYGMLKTGRRAMKPEILVLAVVPLPKKVGSGNTAKLSMEGLFRETCICLEKHE